MDVDKYIEKYKKLVKLHNKLTKKSDIISSCELPQK